MSVAGLLIAYGLAGCIVLQLLLWVYQQRTSEADIVDVGWTASLGMLALWYAIGSQGDQLNRILVALYAGAWSLRLGTYLLCSRVLVSGEDERYAELRRSWGSKASRNFFIFFLAQAVLAVILSLPFLVIAVSQERVSALSVLVSLTIAGGAILGEASADAQLRAFRAKPENRGTTCRVGLWRYSRHPNYFFEWLYWLSFVALGISLPFGFVTLIGPLVMYWFLIKITGIPATEARALASRGENYREYQRTTNMFFPWLPRT